MGLRLRCRRLQTGAAAEAHRGDRLMAKVPACAKAFVGRWRIAEMDVWDNDFLDLVEEAHLTLKGTADGEIVFGALKGFFDVRYGAASARPAQSSRGKATMRTIQHAVVDGLSLAPQDAWSATSTSTTATIQASYASAPDFFNSLLGLFRYILVTPCRVAATALYAGTQIQRIRPATVST